MCYLVRMARPALLLTSVVVIAASPAYAWIESFTGSPPSLLSTDDPDFAQHVAIDGAGGVVAAGRVVIPGTEGVPDGGRMIGVSKRDTATGKELWRRVFSTATLEAPRECLNGCSADVLHVEDGGDVLVGASLLQNVGGNEWMGAVRLNGADGSLEWGWVDPGSVLAAGAADSQDDLLLGGMFRDAFSVDYSFTVVKLDGMAGTVDWQYVTAGDQVGSNPVNRAAAVAADSADDIVAAGTTTNLATGRDVTVVKLDGATGAEIWKTVVSAPGDNFSSALALASNGDAFVADYPNPAGTQFVSRLDGTTGIELWRVPFDTSPEALAGTANGDVVIAGGVVVGGDPSDLVVARLAGATGADVWRTTVDGAATDISIARGLSIAPDGRVLVAGQVAYDSDADFVVLELDPDTGAILRTTRVDGTAGASDFAEDVVADAAGRRFAAGAFENRTGNDQDTDFAMIGYAPGLTGRKLVASDPGGNGKLKVQSKDNLLLAPAPGTPNDPTVVGATIELVNPVTSELATFSAPASLWTVRSGKKAGSYRYTFKDGTGVAGPCKVIVLVNGKKLKAACTRGLGGFTLDEPSQGALDVHITLGSDDYCTSFQAPLVDQPGHFVAKNAPAPTSCQ